MGSGLKAVRGSFITFTSDPFLTDENQCYNYVDDGLIVIGSGKIVCAGPYADTVRKYPDVPVTDTFADSLIIPGMVDAHVHYVQTPMIGSFGCSLLDWLNSYAFPTERMFADKVFADEVARIFFQQILQQGTTTANVFATTFAQSVDSLFEESERYNALTITGKVLQDRNLPEYLRDPDTEQSVEIAEELLGKWHGRGRQMYAVIPRFAPTSTPRQLALAGELYQRHKDEGVYMHTHLDEDENEIEWVRSLFPDDRNYTDVYRRFGLVADRSVFAHACLVTPDEWQTLAAEDCAVVHCPSSNLFLGDGLFKYWEAKDPARPVRTALGTDVGAGTNFSVLRQMGEAYKVGMISHQGLSPIRSLYLATRGGAQALHLEHRIGSIAPGFDADLAVLDLCPDDFTRWRMQFCTPCPTPSNGASSHPSDSRVSRTSNRSINSSAERLLGDTSDGIAERLLGNSSDSIADRLFVLATLGLNNCNRATFIAGHKVYDRSRSTPFLHAPSPD